MAIKKLTDLFVERLKPPARGRVEVFDAGFPALALRVTERGHKSWSLFYRTGGRLRRFTIGCYPQIKPARARALATAALDQVRGGTDPATLKQAQRHEPQPKAEKAETFEDLARDYLERHVRKNCGAGTYQEARRLLQVDVYPRWGRRLPASISKRDAIDLIDAIAERAPIHANRTLARLRALFNWAVERDRIAASPLTGLKPPSKEVSRDRWLDEREIVWFWQSCDALGYPFGPLFKLLLLTAQRRDEVGLMTWAEIDFAQKLWVIPRDKIKGGRGAHEVQLSDPALALLESLPRLGPFVFTGRNGAAATGFSHAKIRLDTAMSELAGDDTIEPFILHDLRRTAASHMARLNVPPHVVDRILNHSSGSIRGVAAIYNRFEYAAERRAALATWGNHVERLVRPTRSISAATRPLATAS